MGSRCQPSWFLQRLSVHCNLSMWRKGGLGVQALDWGRFSLFYCLACCVRLFGAACCKYWWWDTWRCLHGTVVSPLSQGTTYLKWSLFWVFDPTVKQHYDHGTYWCRKSKRKGRLTFSSCIFFFFFFFFFSLHSSAIDRSVERLNSVRLHWGTTDIPFSFRHPSFRGMDGQGIEYWALSIEYWAEESYRGSSEPKAYIYQGLLLRGTFPYLSLDDTLFCRDFHWLYVICSGRTLHLAFAVRIYIHIYPYISIHISIHIHTSLRDLAVTLFSGSSKHVSWIKKINTLRSHGSNDSPSTDIQPRSTYSTYADWSTQDPR